MTSQSTSQSCPRGRWPVAAALAWSLCLGVAGSAAAQTAPDALSQLGAQTQRWLDDTLARSQTSAMPLRMEVSVGSLDPRLQLAPCNKVEPYLPNGARLWGRTRLGLRCVEGTVAWNVFLPVTVKAWGPAWVLSANVAPGATLTMADATEAEVDWAADTANVLASPDKWVGQMATRQLVVGQALRQNMVRPPSLFKAGAQVKVVVRGPGYAITSEAQSLGNGAAGQTVRLKMDNGRMVNGIVNEDGTVSITL